VYFFCPKKTALLQIALTAWPAAQERRKTKICNGILHIRDESLEFSHLRAYDVFHGEDYALFPFAQRRNCMPELVAIENYHGAGLGRNLNFLDLPFGVIFVEMADQPAAFRFLVVSY
jgi:hypothetical protein